MGSSELTIHTHTKVFSMGASSNTICEDDMDVVLFVCFVCLFVCLAFCLEATLDNHVCATLTTNNTLKCVDGSELQRSCNSKRVDANLSIKTTVNACFASSVVIND